MMTKLKQIKEVNEPIKNKIDLEIVMVAEEFFESFPKVYRNSFRNRSIENDNNEAWSQTNFSKLINSGSILMNSGIGSLSEFLHFESGQKSHLTSLNINHKWRSNPEDNPSLTCSQIQLMEAKIFIPHMISFGMIIHYGDSSHNKNQDLLSLMEIIQKQKFSK